MRHLPMARSRKSKSQHVALPRAAAGDDLNDYARLRLGLAGLQRRTPRMSTVGAAHKGREEVYWLQSVRIGDV